jgi:hypothetical protein
MLPLTVIKERISVMASNSNLSKEKETFYE